MEFFDKNLENSITKEDIKICNCLEQRGKGNDEILSYLRFKKDTLNEHYDNLSSATKNAAGLIILTTSAYFSTGPISNLCLGISFVCLIGAGYDLIRDRKTRDKYNSTNENLGLSFVKKI